MEIPNFKNLELAKMKTSFFRINKIHILKNQQSAKHQL
jgi:hypothetical protein